jgi:hypothetical protein
LREKRFNRVISISNSQLYVNYMEPGRPLSCLSTHFTAHH